MGQDAKPRQSDQFDFDKRRASLKYDFSKEDDDAEDQAQMSKDRTPLYIAAAAIAAICIGTAAYNLTDENSAEKAETLTAEQVTTGSTTKTSQTAKADATSEVTTQNATAVASSTPAETETANMATGASSATPVAQDKNADEGKAVVETDATNMTTGSVTATPAAQDKIADEGKAVVETDATTPAQKTAEKAITCDATTDEETLAMDAIRGVYGNGETRKERLGERYASVQKRINAIYKKKQEE